MPLPFHRKKIHCPNCNYDGRATIKGSNIAGFLCFGFFIFGVFIWPLLVVSALILVYIVFKPAAWICPKCRYANTIPFRHYRKHASV